MWMDTLTVTCPPRRGGFSINPQLWLPALLFLSALSVWKTLNKYTFSHLFSELYVTRNASGWWGSLEPGSMGVNKTKHMAYRNQKCLLWNYYVLGNCTSSPPTPDLKSNALSTSTWTSFKLGIPPLSIIFKICQPLPMKLFFGACNTTAGRAKYRQDADY